MTGRVIRVELLTVLGEEHELKPGYLSSKKTLIVAQASVFPMEVFQGV